MYNHILLPTDGSALARKAAHAGVKLAQALGARVTGFYAAPPATPVEFKGIFQSAFSIRRSMRSRSKGPPQSIWR